MLITFYRPSRMTRIQLECGRHIYIALEKHSRRKDPITAECVRTFWGFKIVSESDLPELRQVRIHEVYVGKLDKYYVLDEDVIERTENE